MPREPRRSPPARGYGPGPKAAVIAGVMTWILGYAMPNYALWYSGIFGGSLMALASAIGLVEFILATLAGAWVYKPAGPGRGSLASAG